VKAQRDYWLTLGCAVMGMVVITTTKNLKDYASVKTDLKKSKSAGDVPDAKVKKAQ
ncbi:hypothetical protein HDU93_001757, partial [Gonapodya sp. JEL0774]